MKPTPMQALEKAVELAGSQSELARRLAEHTKNDRIKPAHVWNWLNRDKQVPANMAVPIEEVTPKVAGELQVTRQQLRPDLYQAEKAA